MKSTLISDLLYRAYMADAITDTEVQHACSIFGITYPPQIMGYQGTQQSPVVQQLKEDHGIHCN